VLNREFNPNLPTQHSLYLLRRVPLTVELLDIKVPLVPQESAERRHVQPDIVLVIPSLIVRRDVVEDLPDHQKGIEPDSLSDPTPSRAQPHVGELVNARIGARAPYGQPQNSADIQVPPPL